MDSHSFVLLCCEILYTACVSFVLAFVSELRKVPMRAYGCTFQKKSRNSTSPFSNPTAIILQPFFLHVPNHDALPFAHTPAPGSNPHDWLLQYKPWVHNPSCFSIEGGGFSAHVIFRNFSRYLCSSKFSRLPHINHDIFRYLNEGWLACPSVEKCRQT